MSFIKRSLFKGKVIGITGSAGKTSLKEYLKLKKLLDQEIKNTKQNLIYLLFY